MLDAGIDLKHYNEMLRHETSEEDINHAYENQLYKNSGFWELRRYLGQFVDITEDISTNPPDLIVCAGISGCVIGE